MLHLGTLVALLVYFWRDWLRLIAGRAAPRSAIDRSPGDPDRRLAWLLVAATVPARRRRRPAQRRHRDAVPRGRAWSQSCSSSAAAILWLADRWGPRDARSTTLTFPLGARHRRRAGARPRPGHQPLGHLDLGRPPRRPRSRVGGPLQLPDGHARSPPAPSSSRPASCVAGEAGVAGRGRARSSSGSVASLVVGPARDPRSCSATSGPGRSTSSSAYRVVARGGRAASSGCCS